MKETLKEYNMNLEKLLAENMIRFGTRNLTAEQVAAASGAKDAAWVKAVQKLIEGKMGALQMKYKPGATYTTKYTTGIYAMGSQAKYILPKNSSWTTSPSGFFLITTAKRIMSGNFGYETSKFPGEQNFSLNGILDVRYCEDIINGKKMGFDKSPVKFQDIQIVVTPHNQSTLPYMEDEYNSASGSSFKFTNQHMGTMLNKLKA